MKKLLLIILAFFMMLPAGAKNKAVVECLEDFSSDGSSVYFNARVIERADFTNGIVFEENSIIRAKVIEVIEAKRAKRDAYFIIQPIAYTQPSKKRIKKIPLKNWEAKVIGYKPFSWKKTAESAGVGVTNHLVEGVGTVYHFGKGFIHPDGKNGRLKSGAKEAYENSIFSYISKGKSLDVKTGDILEMVFYNADIPKWKVWKRND